MRVEIHVPYPLRRYSNEKAVLPVDFAGDRLGEALGALFRDFPELRPRLLDEEDRVQPYLLLLRGTEELDRAAWREVALVDGDEIDIVPAVEGGSGAEETRFTKEMEVIPDGLLSWTATIRVDGEAVGKIRRRFWGGADIEVAGSEALHLRRVGFFRGDYQLELGESGQVIGRVVGQGFFQRSFDLELGDRSATIAPPRFFSTRRDLIVGGRIVAATSHRGLFKGGFLVRAEDSVSEIEMLLLGLVAQRARERQSAAASS